MMPRQCLRRTVFLTAIGFGLLAHCFFSPLPCHARPPAHELVPKNTLVFVQARSVPELVERIQDTAMGRLARDPQIAPLLKNLYSAAEQEYAEKSQEKIGASLEEMLKIPQGEIALAVVSREQKPPAVLLMMDLADDPRAARKVLEQIEAQLIADGGDREEKVLEDLRVTVINMPDPNVEVVHFEKDQTLVLVADRGVALALLEVWNGGEGETLAQNPSYQTIRSRCHLSGEDAPHLSFFVDPIGLAEDISRGNFQARLGLAALPALGLDGLRGIGGSITWATETYDQVVHLHVLLDNPRGGIPELILLNPVESRPESWIPADVETYLTVQLDAQHIYAKLNKLVDSFQHDGAFKKMVEQNVSEPAGIDFEKDLIEELEGRFIILRSFENPARLMSQPNSFAFKVNDPEAMRRTLDKLMSRFENDWTKGNTRGINFYHPNPPGRGNRPPEQQMPIPCVAVVEDYLIIAQSEDFLERLITTSEGGGDRLSDSIDYSLVSKRIERLAAGGEPALVLINRPEESMRYVYSLVTSERASDWLSNSGNENRFAKNVGAAMEENPLPPFEVLAKYLAPSGGMVIDDDTGFHYVGFTLRRE